MGDIAVAGGQECELPPQQEHRKPSIAQYFQYSQFCGSLLALLCAALAADLCGVGAAPSGAPAASARLMRSIGSNGSKIVPVSTWPSTATKLRREVRCANERDDFSNKRSSGCIALASGIQEQPGCLPQIF